MPECEYCGDELHANSLLRHKRAKHDDFLPVRCPTCDTGFETQSGMRRHHSQVHDETLAKETRKCSECGEEFECWEYREYHSTCSNECRRASQASTIKGDGNPNWEEGYERPNYGTTWEEKREEILKRDGYECRICGRSESMKDPLHVHHLVKVKKFDDPDNAHMRDNLITLCSSHHRLVETGRIECPEPEAIDEVDVDDVLEY